ncbi:hypothetical protein [Clostridium estertheticum]|uniref:hypothetical protein n=1 Tax=Clostridium estertheticum TaxID=238834 RepID=UPI0019568449|nr:hypothetical protein [Clostridium estertheticum]
MKSGGGGKKVELNKQQKDYNKAIEESKNGDKVAANPKAIYGELDSLVRPTGINATITRDMIGTGSSARSSIKPPGFLGGVEGHAR